MAGMLNQPIQAQAQTQVMPQVMPQMLPNFPVQAMPFDMGQGFGAARFLTGDAMIPLTYDIPAQEFTPMQFKPGDFSKYRAQLAMSEGNPFAQTFGQIAVNKLSE